MTNNKEKLIRIITRHGFRISSKFRIDHFDRYSGIGYDLKGNKYFIKATYGRKTYRFQSLLYESKVTKLLSKKSRRFNINFEGYRIFLPEVVKIITQNDFLIFITRFIRGQKLSTMTKEIQSKIIVNSILLVFKLGNKAKLRKKDIFLKNYSLFSLVMLIPLRFFKALTLFPKVVIGIFNVFWKSLPILRLVGSEHGLVHPDINASNIILKNKKIYLTDWEEAGWGISLYNAVTPVAIYWGDRTLRSFLLKFLVQNNIRDKIRPLLAYRILVLFNQKSDNGSTRLKRDLKILKYLNQI